MKKIQFNLTYDSTVPPWMQLRQWLLEQIKSGQYPPQAKMPTIRSLASEVSMNNNTISKAYTSLINDGYLYSKQGSGVFVADIATPRTDERSKTVDFALESCISTCRDLGLSFQDIEKAMQLRVRSVELKEEKETYEKELIR